MGGRFLGSKSPTTYGITQTAEVNPKSSNLQLMMASFARLPAELLDLIFSNLFAEGWLDSKLTCDLALQMRLVSCWLLPFHPTAIQTSITRAAADGYFFAPDSISGLQLQYTSPNCPGPVSRAELPWPENILESAAEWLPAPAGRRATGAD